MLVISRKYGERTVIVTPDGTRIEVVVVDIDRGKIRLGFDAPPTVKIWRAELLEAKRA